MLRRMDDSLLARWWWTIDRLQLLSILALMLAGFVLTWAASPAVADRLGEGRFYFVERQALFQIVAIIVLLGLSLLNRRDARRLAVALLPASLIGVVLTLGIGAEINGATRWLSIAGQSVQPSELLKPTFTVMCAWLLAAGVAEPGLPARRLSFILLLAVLGLLAAQPDIGQALLVGFIWVVQMLLAGLPLVWLLLVAAVGIAAMTLSYLSFDHVAARIDRFIDPTSGDTYQTDQALAAFRHGGLLGTGPGEGEIKRALPDAHTDFIFAVAGEEFGMLASLVFVALFAAISLRALSHLVAERDPFTIFAVGGLIAQFAGQALINLSVTLALIPPKGMTLPLVSYGGSSMVSMAFTLGLMLAFSRRPRQPRQPLALIPPGGRR